LFSSQTNFVVLESPLSIFDHIPQADCLLPQESFGIENDVLGDDDANIYTFNNIVCHTPSFASSVSIKIGTEFIQISRRKILKLPEKKQFKSFQESGGHSHQSEASHSAQGLPNMLNDAIPRSGGGGKEYIFHRNGAHDLRLETKTWLNKNIKLKCEGDQQMQILKAEISTLEVFKESDSVVQSSSYGALSLEEYISKILVVSLMGLCDSNNSIRTESQCLLSRIFRRLGSGSAFEHTMFSCPPSNMNRLIQEISSRMVVSNPRLALPFLESSLSVIKTFKSSLNPPVNLQYHSQTHPIGDYWVAHYRFVAGTCFWKRGYLGFNALCLICLTQLVSKTLITISIP
jgi:hypothetical protein